MASLEIANIAIWAFMAVSVCWASERRFPRLGSWVGLACMAGLLVQGATYWKWKAGVLEGDPRRFPLARFRRWKRTNPLALMVGGLLVVALSRGIDLWLGGAAWAMAVLEQVNYFHLQLMHDTREDWSRLLRDRRLRPSALAKDMRAAERSNADAGIDR